MKKVVSFVLSFLFFIQALPWQALAEEDVPGIPDFGNDPDNGISSQQLSAALALAGLEESAPSWHEGMSAGSCATASQLAEVLKEFVYDYFDGVLDTFQDYDMLSSEGKLNLSGSSFQDAYKDALDLRDDVYYYLDVLEENSRQISYLNVMIKDPDTEEEDRISYEYSLLDYYEELKDAFDVVKDSLGLWENTCNQWDRMLCGETPEFKPYADQYAVAMHADNTRNTGSPVLLAMEKETAPSRGNRIIDRLSPITSALADTRKKMEITVVDDRSFIVRTKNNGTNVSGASVTLRDVDKNGKSRGKQPISLTTSAKGVAIGLVRDYSPDKSGNITLDIGIKKDGYRTVQLRKVEIKKGSTFNVRLEKDDGTPYVIEASYNGSDMMNNRYELLVSDMAKATDEVTLTTYGKSAYTFDLYYTKDGKKNMLASDIQGKSGEETRTSLKKQFAKAIPGDAKLFIDLKSGRKTKTVPLQLKPIRAVVDEPMNLPGVSSVFNKNITLNLPKSWPGPLSAMKVNIDIPLVNKWPFNAMIFPNGMAFVMVGFHAGKKGMDDLKNNWAKVMGKMVKQVESEGWRRVQEIKSGGASDFKLPVWKLATMTLDWCIMGYGTGQFTGIKGRDDLRVLRLAGNVGINVKMQGDVQFIFGGIATVGVTGTLNAIVSMGMGLNIFYAQSGRNWKYQRWEYSPSNSGLTITVRLELGVFAGLGFKGVASVTVNGYGFLELVCRWGKQRSYQLIGGFGARLTAQFFFIKAVKQLGEEIKYQLLPSFRRLAFRPEQLNRFIQMFQPATALADNAKKDTNVVSSSSVNDKLVLTNNAYSELRNIQDDSISVVRVHTGSGSAESKNDYVFYLARNSGNVDLYFRGARTSTSPASVLKIIEAYHNTHSNRFLENDSLTFNTVKSWDVVDYHIETMPLPTDSGRNWGGNRNLYIITMLMAKEYQEVSVAEGTKVRVPRKTAAMVATFLGGGTNGIQMGEFSPNSNTNKFASAVSIFMAAGENDAPICHPVTETELIGSNGTGTGTGKPSYWIRLTCSPTSSVAAEKVKSYSIRLDLGHPTDTGRTPSQEKMTGSITSRTLGLGNASIGSYTFEHVRPGAQRYNGHPYLKDAANSEIAVQDHWYALATPKGQGDDHYLFVNFNAMNNTPKKGSDLYQLDKEPVLDFCVYKQVLVADRKLGKEFVIYLTKGTNNKMNRLRGATVTVNRSDKNSAAPNLEKLYWADMIDFDVGASTTEIHVSTIYGAPLVWWIEAVSADEKNGNKATWTVRGCWLNDNPAERCLSKPMTFAVIREKTASKKTRGPIFFDLIEENERGAAIVGYYALKSEDSSGNISATLYNFTFKLTPGIDLLSSTFTKEIANAGSYDDIQVAMHNNGNVPISGVDLGIYYKNQKLQDVHVDMEHYYSSYCNIYENGRVKRTIKNSSEKQCAVRMVSSGLSKKLEDRWSIRQWRLHTDKDRMDMRSQKSTALSMPDSYDTVVMAMQIPHKWIGDYAIEIRVEKLYARDKLSFLTKRPRKQSKAVLSPVDRLFAISSAIADDTPDDPGNLLAFSPGTGDVAVITSPEGGEIENTDAYKFSTDLDFDSLTINSAAKDIEVDADVWFDGDEEMVTIYLNESALLPATEENEVVTIQALLDDDETPSYEWKYDSRSVDYEGQLVRDGTGWSLTYPLSVLTGGREASELTIQVDSGNEEEALFSNNYVVLPLDSQPMVILTEPEDRTENAGNNTTFSVEVSGGHSPYSYQWQVLMPGGAWKDITDAWDSRLTLYGVYANLDGAQYRCIIEDASGRTLTSRAATLTVLSSDVSLPPTGDSQNLTVWLLLLGAACLTVFFLIRKKKR